MDMFFFQVLTKAMMTSRAMVLMMIVRVQLIVISHWMTQLKVRYLTNSVYVVVYCVGVANMVDCINLYIYIFLVKI